MSLIKLANDVSDYEYFSKQDPLNATDEYNYRDDNIHAVNVRPKKLNDAYSLYGARTEEDPVGKLEALQHGDPFTKTQRNLRRGAHAAMGAAFGAGTGLSVSDYAGLLGKKKLNPVKSALTGAALMGTVGGLLADKNMDKAELDKANRMAKRLSRQKRLDDIYENHASDYMG